MTRRVQTREHNIKVKRILLPRLALRWPEAEAPVREWLNKQRKRGDVLKFVVYMNIALGESGQTKQEAIECLRKEGVNLP